MSVKLFFLMTELNGSIVDKYGKTIYGVQTKTRTLPNGKIGNTFYHSVNTALSGFKVGEDNNFFIGNEDFTVAFWSYFEKGYYSATGIGTPFFDINIQKVVDTGYYEQGKVHSQPGMYLQSIGYIVKDEYLTNGKWHHFALVRKNGLVTLYVDGSSYVTSNKQWDRSIDLRNKDIHVACGPYYDTSYATGRAFTGSMFNLFFAKGALFTENFVPKTDGYFMDAQGLITLNEPLNLLDKTSVKGFTIDGIEPANTSRKVAFKVDDVWNKINTSGALVPLPTQEITSDSVIKEGNTVSELEALTTVTGMAGKLVYPAIALYASKEAEVMPTFGMTVKAEIDVTVNVYSYITYSQEYTISDDVPIVSVVTETETSGNGAVDITARIKSSGEWSEYMPLNSVQMKKASAIQLKAVYTVQSTDGTDSAKINGVIIKYNTSGAITSNSTTDIVTVTEKFVNDLKYVHAYVKHKELNDAKIKVYCSLRKTPQKRTMYQFGNGTGALKTFTLLDSGINQDTLLVYADGKLVYDYGYNTETSEITITADKDAALSATYEYGWEHSEWVEMEQGVSQINDSGAFTTEYSYTIPAHEGELTVTAIKYELLRPEGKVTDDVIGIGTGKRQIIQLPHYARKETISCNGKWSYDYDSKRLTVIAPEGDNIVISYDWIAESPQVYGVMAGWAD